MDVNKIDVSYIPGHLSCQLYLKTRERDTCDTEWEVSTSVIEAVGVVKFTIGSTILETFCRTYNFVRKKKIWGTLVTCSAFAI